VPCGPRRRVLVVEEELAIRELLRLHLELSGFSLEETGDGRRALDGEADTVVGLESGADD